MLLILLIVSFILRIININQSLWLDEAAQAIESNRPLISQLDIPADFQPPLFHILLSIWIKLGGTSDIWLRLLPVFISIVGILVFYKIADKLYGNKNAIISSFILIFNPFAVYYSQELRPYPLTILTALLIVWGFVKKSRIIVILGIIAFLYTSYFAPFFVGSLFIYIAILDNKNLKWFLQNCLISIIFFLPWVPSFLNQLKNGTDLITKLPGWSEAVSTPLNKAVPLVFAKFYLGKTTIDNKILYLSVVIILISLFLYVCYLLVRQKKYYLPLFLFWGSLLITYIASFFIPIIDPKRMIFILPFFCLILGLGSSKLRGIKKSILFIAILFSFIFGLYSYYTNPRFQREQWKQAVNFVETNGDGTQVVIFAFPDSFAPYQWYSRDLITSISVAPDFVVQPKDLDNMNLVIAERNRVYLFQYLTDLTDPTKSIIQTLESNGFVNTKTHDFPGVGFIYQYDKTPLALAP